MYVHHKLYLILQSEPFKTNSTRFCYTLDILQHGLLKNQLLALGKFYKYVTSIQKFAHTTKLNLH